MVIISTVVTPKEVRAGAASILIQKLIQERITIRKVGIYNWTRKYPIDRFRMKLHWMQENLPFMV